ncbi:lactonase family protein [Novosphingobium flavum]|uniref:Lactonase family protein n=1 Tax=Novosphingobium flavum TaxID=1778672 RepID=A0A7X1FST1_9SPHN|nr:lactonase family protein [Novosphingobium flavum]MBC2666316.1 lactonase family protein [Novosphingobium flavum]
MAGTLRLVRGLSAAAGLLIAVGAVTGPAAAEAPAGTSEARRDGGQLVYVGTRGRGDGIGISAARFDAASGQFTPLGLAVEAVNPTWLMASPHRAVLYAVSEVGNDGKSDGAVLSYTADAATGKLTLLSRVASGGGGATHLALGGMPPTVFVANYGGGTVAALPLQPGGALLAPSSVQHDTGSGPSPRQAGPHPHAVVSAAKGRLLLVGDLGADRIFVYKVDPAAHAISPAEQPFVQLTPGTGPRHLALTPDERFVYSLNEFSNDVAILAFDAGKGRLTARGRVPATRAGFAGENSPAELLLSRDGRFLYVSNRGEDTIVVFRVDGRTGRLAEVQRLAVGPNPAALVFDRTGRWLLVATEGEGKVRAYAVDRARGTLAGGGGSFASAHPVTIAVVGP